MAKRSRNLLSYFGEENDLDTGTEEPEQSISRPKRSKHRESGYNPSWGKTFPWLEYKVDHGLYCTLCKTHNLDAKLTFNPLRQRKHELMLYVQEG